MKKIIDITENAKHYLINACAQQNRNTIRLEVVGGGCAGFSYKYDFSDETDTMDSIIPLDDSRNFVVDGTSLMYVIGTVLDYEQKLGQSALVFKNPNETSSCGCGKSFSL